MWNSKKDWVDLKHSLTIPNTKQDNLVNDVKRQMAYYIYPQIPASLAFITTEGEI